MRRKDFQFNRLIALSVWLWVFVSLFQTGAGAASVPAEDEPVHTGDFLMGDMDFDGRVSADDARILLRSCVGLQELPQQALPYSDMDYDCRLRANDARLALRTAVGLEKEEMHDFVLLSHLDPDCTAQGKDSFRCTACQKEISINSPARGHKWSQATLLKKSLCTVCGEENPNGKLSAESCCGYILPLVDNGKIKDAFYGLTVNCGNRLYKNQGNTQGFEYIRKTLSSYGFSNSELVIDGFENNKVQQKNIYAVISTAVKNPQIAVICAHYDSAAVGEGAVDNGSGVACVLEAARIFKSLSIDFGIEVRFCLFSGEEQGYLGAYRYLKYSSEKDGADYARRHGFVLNCDMTAHPKDMGSPCLCVSTEAVLSNSPAPKAQNNYASEKINQGKKLSGSCGESAYYNPVAAGKHDLTPFRKHGIAGATLSWREQKSSNKADDYGLTSPALIHTARDTFENTDLNSLYATARLVVASVSLMLYDFY